jgi:hypothetical protein
MQQYAAEMERLSSLIDRGIAALTEHAREMALAEHDYRKAKAIAWTQAPPGTVPVREAWVEAETAEARLRLDMAEGMRLAALESVRSRRQQLSALQSLLAATKSEMDFARTGPR